MISVLIFCVLNVPNHFLCCFDALAIQNVFFVMPIKLSELNWNERERLSPVRTDSARTAPWEWRRPSCTFSQNAQNINTSETIITPKLITYFPNLTPVTQFHSCRRSQMLKYSCKICSILSHPKGRPETSKHPINTLSLAAVDLRTCIMFNIVCFLYRWFLNPLYFIN